MKPCTAASTSTMLRASARSAGSLIQRQYGSGARMRRNSAGKILSRWLLDDFVVGLQRVDLGAECEPGDRVDRVAHQVGLQVDRVAAPRRTLPAPASRHATRTSDGK